MSSTSAVNTLISIVSPLSSDVLSQPSAPPSHVPSSSIVSLHILVTILSTVPLSTSTSSKPFQQSSSALQTTMPVTTVPPSAVPTSAGPSVPPSTVSPTSAVVSSTSFSAPSATTASTSNDNRSTTPTPATSQPTILLTPTTPTTTLLSAPTSSSITPLLSTLTSATPISAIPSTSNMPFTTTSLPSPSNSPPQGSSTMRTEMPLYEFPSDACAGVKLNAVDRTTMLESTTIFITSTNSQGQVVTSVPRVVTEVITTTGSGGLITTVTQAVVNPTLATNSITTGGSSFFGNTGTVVGVFVVVGLATASIMMWILFAIRRRQRMRRIEQDTAVEAAVAAAGLNRAPLDDDDDDISPISPNTYHQSGMAQRSTLLDMRGSDSLPTSTRLSEALEDSARDSPNSHPGCPVEHCASSHPGGYMPARTASPSPRAERCADELGSSRDRKSSYGHTPTYSAGSFEPLLANYIQSTSDQDTSAFTMELPRNRSSRHLGSSLAAPNGHSEDGSGKTSLKRRNSSGSSVVLADEDYTRYVLTVRNVPDNQSQHSSQ